MLLPSTVALTGWHLSPCTMTLVTTTTTSQAPTTRHLEAYLGAFAEFTDVLTLEDDLENRIKEELDQALGHLRPLPTR